MQSAGSPLLDEARTEDASRRLFHALSESIRASGARAKERALALTAASPRTDRRTRVPSLSAPAELLSLLEGEVETILRNAGLPD